MNQLRPEIEGATIVLIGSFNPKIFQPAWFAAEDLIRKEEAETASIEVIHHKVTSFSTDWFSLQVTDGRFTASTAQSPSYNPLQDLVLSTFRLLRHTPIHMMGLNWNFHFLMASEDAWHALGHRLAPQEPWNNILENPGMRSLTMEMVRPDAFGGYIRVRVEPSVRIHPGVFIHVNDHYQVKDPEASQGCDEIIDILDSEWSKSLERSSKMSLSLMESK